MFFDGAVSAAMGGTYSFVRAASANLREKDDTWNTALGGFFAGSILGLRGEQLQFWSSVREARIGWAAFVLTRIIARTLPSVFGYGTALAVTLAAFDYTGGSLFGKDKDPNIDKYEQLERIRKNYRTPAEQTIAEIGEGRGKAVLSYAILFFFISLCFVQLGLLSLLTVHRRNLRPWVR